MASAMVNTAVVAGVSPEPFPWLSPRVSFSRDLADDVSDFKPSPENPDMSAAGTGKDPADFEFLLGEDPVAMLPADELFSDGKLVPLQLAATAKPPFAAAAEVEEEPPAALIRLPETVRSCRRAAEVAITSSDPCVFSPRAPRCTARWKELLGLRKAAQSAKPDPKKCSASSATIAADSKSPNPRSLKRFLNRNPRSDSSLSLPLLRESDSDSAVSISARLSLSSSSSSGPDHDDLPRHSLDSDKSPNPPSPISLSRPPPPSRPAVNRSRSNIPARARRPAATEGPPAAVAELADSPRMNASGRVVFAGLERSSSSPAAGARPQLPRGMERSYSAGVRVTPVLNVPVCAIRLSASGKPGSVFGIGPLFTSPQRKDKEIGPARRTGGSKTTRAARAPRD